MKFVRAWILPIVLMTSGCATSYRPIARGAAPVDVGVKRTVYVVNPELGSEFAILKESGIYELTNDPSHSSKLTLNKMSVVWREEGMLYLVSWFTLGLAPVSFQDATAFSYSIEGPEGITEYEYVVAVQERHSIWEWFRGASRLSEEQALAEGLAVAVSLRSAALDG